MRLFGFVWTLDSGSHMLALHRCGKLLYINLHVEQFGNIIFITDSTERVDKSRAKLFGVIWLDTMITLLEIYSKLSFEAILEKMQNLICSFTASHSYNSR